MPRDAELRWFVDATSLGVARALAQVRGDVVYPGHRRVMPGIPDDAKDQDWMPIVADLGLVVISRDRHIRSKLGELEAFLAYGLRAFWIAGDKDLGNWENLGRIVKSWDRMERIVRDRPTGPWFYEVHQTRLTEIVVRPRTRTSGPPPAPAPRSKPAVRPRQDTLGL
jgi:hypothetical protein